MTTDQVWARPWAKKRSSAPIVTCGVGSDHPEWNCGHDDTERLEEFFDVYVDESRPIYRCLRPECRFTNHALAGTRWEEMVVTYLRSIGPAFAEARRWSQDEEWPEGAGIPPDVAGVTGWTVECKNRKGHQYVELAQSMDELERERAVTCDAFAALISRRRGVPIEDSYVVMKLCDWAKLIAGQPVSN